MYRRTIGLATLAVAALALPAAAQAHVTVSPREATAGAFTELQIRVPTERDDASTTKVEVQMPEGFVEASYEPRPGWTVHVTKRKLAKPVKTDDGEVTEEVATITWTGSGHGSGEIAPGEFMDFPLSVQIPEDAGGKTLTFKALQTYSDGQVVRWIGAADADTPAPTLEVAAADAAKTVGAADTGDASDGGGSDALSIVALIVGAAGLLAAGAALVAVRRPRRT